MAHRVAIVDDSAKDAEFVQSILNSWAELRQANIQTEVVPFSGKLPVPVYGG